MEWWTAGQANSSRRHMPYAIRPTSFQIHATIITKLSIAVMKTIHCLFVLTIASARALTVHIVKQSRASSRLFSKEETQQEILNQLNEAYHYEGRLPSGGRDHRCGFVCIVGAPNMGKVSGLNGWRMFVSENMVLLTFATLNANIVDIDECVA